MSKLNYHHLQYFHAIATYGSIVKASKEQIGYQLFDRKGKRLMLNDMGQITFSYAQEIFSLGDELMSSLKNHSTDFNYRFSIGVTDVIAKVFSFNFLKAVYTMDEKIKLVCKETNLEVLLGELATNKLDAVLSDTSLPSGSALNAYSHLVGKSGFSFFCNKEKAKALADNFPQSLNGTPFFTAGEGSNQHLSMLSWLEQLNISPMIIGEFDDSVLTKYFGQAGYGVFCAPTIVENHVMEHFKVEIIGRTTEITEHYYLISPERKVKHPAVQHLLVEGKKLFERPMF